MARNKSLYDGGKFSLLAGSPAGAKAASNTETSAKPNTKHETPTSQAMGNFESNS